MNKKLDQLAKEYILECIDSTGYNVEVKTDTEKLQFLFDTFMNEVGSWRAPQYSRVLAGMSLKNVKPYNKVELKPVSRVKKDRSREQKRASLLHKDRIQTAKQDMINHIQDLMDQGELTYTELMNDPTIYFDSQIMGKYYNNPIICKSIVKHFETDFIPF